MSANDWGWLVTTLLFGVAGYFFGVNVTTNRVERMMYMMQIEIQSYSRMIVPDEGEDEDGDS